MTLIAQDLHQFSTHLSPINLSFHQYLLSTAEPILVHTGNIQQAKTLIPQLKSVLSDKALKYVFISHFEADECGGLAHVLNHFPDAKVIASEVTGRQLNGFGLVNEVIVKKAGEKLNGDTYELEFFTYPSEMHLWEGLLLIENRREIFFSSDLMLRFGEAAGSVIDSTWSEEVENIKPEQVPDPQRLLQLKNTLAKLTPQFVATGHGPCLRVR